MPKLAGVLVALLTLIPVAQAEVHEVLPQQFLQLPGDPVRAEFPALAVAIDGDWLVVIADHDGARQALLYRRGSDRQWAYSRVLVQSTAPASQLRASVAMKNALAAINLSGDTTLSGAKRQHLDPGDYRRSDPSARRSSHLGQNNPHRRGRLQRRRCHL